MRDDSLGWKDKKVRHDDGREGVIVREYVNFDYCECTVRLNDGSNASFTLCAGEDHRTAQGWSWYCEDFSGGPKWLRYCEVVDATLIEPSSSASFNTCKEIPLAIVFAKVKDSPRSAHQTVTMDDVLVGEVWREQVWFNTVSSFTKPQKQAMRWRWFAKQAGKARTLGKGTRIAMIMGRPGFANREAAKDELIKASTGEAQALA